MFAERYGMLSAVGLQLKGGFEVVEVINGQNEATMRLSCSC